MGERRSRLRRCRQLCGGQRLFQVAISPLSPSSARTANRTSHVTWRTAALRLARSGLDLVTVTAEELTRQYVAVVS